MRLRLEIAAALLGAHAALGLDPSRAITQYRWDGWSARDGLPQNSVESIAQTRDGYLWLGTQEGLARFDGVRFAAFDRGSTPQLDHNRILALHAARDGSLWIGTEGGGLLRYDRGVFRAAARRGGPDARVRAFCETPDGTLWAGTARGLLRFAPGSLAPAEVRVLAGAAVNALAAGADGSLLIGTASGLHRLRGGSLEEPPGAPRGNVTALAAAPGGAWCGGEEGVVFLGAGGARSAPLAVTSPRALLVDGDGVLWIASGAGLHRWARGRLDLLPRGGELLRGVLNCLFLDREGSLFVGVQDEGLKRLADASFVTWGRREGLSADIVSPILETRDGAIWIGTRGGGLDRLKGGAVTVLGADVLGSADVQSLLETRDGTLWVGTRDAGLVLLREGGVVSRLGRVQGLAGLSIKSLCETPDGSVWVGGAPGKLQRWKEGVLTTWGAESGLPPSEAFFLLPARDGTLWIATNGGGLVRFQGGRAGALTTRDGLTADIVNTLHEEADGTLWIGTYGGGLNRLRGGRLASVTTKQGLYDDAVFRILPGGDGSFWISCNKGVYRVAVRDLDAVADRRAARVSCTVFGTADGMRNRECNGAEQPVGWRTRDGRLFFPTIEGAVCVDPRRLRANPLPPPVAIEEVLVDGRRRDARAPLSIGPGAQQLEIRYAGLSFRDPAKVAFRYRVEGLDSGWVDAGTRRAAFYTHLPPGEHVFRVSACNEAGVWNEAGAALAFRVRPRFTETFWFWLLCGGALAVAIGGGYRYRLARLTAQKAALEHLVDEKVRELSRAEAKIAALTGSDPAKIENVSGWASGFASEISPMIGGARVGVFRLDGDAFRPLVEGGPQPPDLAALRREDGKRVFARAPELAWVPVRGMTGELRGALSVEGPGAGSGWSETQRRLLLGFAQHLGGALELLDLREKLTAAARERERARRSLEEQGVATVVVCPVCRACHAESVVRCPADGARLDRSRLLPLLVLGRYRLTRLLGEGGMGIVFAAHDEELGRDVAVKVIRPEQLSDAGGRLRLEREARAIARIRHPGVVALHDARELEDGSACLVMELLRGLDLADVLHRFGPGTPRQVGELALQAGAALSAAHRAGVVHRDVKPANVFFERSGGRLAVKVVDFGLALSEGAPTRLTQSGMIVGTPLYMSPEQVRGGALDARSDLFSLASVVFEALTGRSPFEGGDTARVWLRIVSEPPPRVADLLPGTPAAVDAVFASALARRPEDRAASAAEWGERLAEVLEPLETAAGRGWPAELAGEPAAAPEAR